MTAVLDKIEVEQVTEEVVTEPVASWVARAGAFAIDVLLPVAVLVTIGLLWFSSSRGGWLWWLAVSVGGVVVLALLANRTLLPVITGWSVGRALMGIRVVRTGKGGDVPAGPWRLVIREMAHLLDTLSLFIGWLWPLWDGRNRTFADLLLHTEARRVEPRGGNTRRLTVGVLIGAVVLSAAATGVGYVAVYRHEHAVAAARDQIRIQGPKIVTEMLSYGPGSLQQDFARAQSLTTDSYRPKLVAEQETAKKAAPTTNEYWVANSAVLSVTPDRAVMLMMLQGQRTVSQKDTRMISATVRVTFEKSRAGQWRVADLTVLSAPRKNGPGK